MDLQYANTLASFVRFAFPLRRLFVVACALGIALLVIVAVTRLLWPTQVPPQRVSIPSRLGAEQVMLPSLPEVGLMDFLSRLRIAPHVKRDRRILAVVMENHEDARPYQRGLADALFVGEFLVEGFISRFVLLFDLAHVPPSIGPVRSLRPYFLSIIDPWASALLYAGGSPEGLAALAESPVPWVNVLGVDDAPLRDPTVPAPHNMFLGSEHVRAFIADAARRSIPWPPYRVGAAPVGSGASLIRLQFFNPLHDVTYTYDVLQEVYIRRGGAVAEQGKPANVLILAMPIAGEGEYGRLAIHPEGRGRALLFRSGVLQQGFWERTPTGPFRFLDAGGHLLLFAPGQTWMTVLPTLDRVRWEGGFPPPAFRPRAQGRVTGEG